MTTDESKRSKRLLHRFEWIPPHARKSCFGGLVSPRPPELRKPILWLARDRDELYLVNAGNEALDRVEVDAGGFQTVDDDVVTVSGASPLIYENILPRGSGEGG